jgi:peptidoglycan/xylan/chitin deacetylase (PgdA/CDA1 family)
VRRMVPVTVHPLEGVRPPVPARLSGDPGLLREAAHGLPTGAAVPEAMAARIRRTGGELAWGEPTPPPDGTSRLAYCRARGASSVEIVRVEPDLLPELQIGSYFDAPFAHRVMRNVALRLRVPPRVRPLLAADVAFWSGVRAAATSHEWRRLACSSYVVLYYHRIAGEGKPGQERIDISPKVFERHMRLLRGLGLRPLPVHDLVAFHTDPGATLPRRSVVVSADDGFVDTLLALRRWPELLPLLFVPTACVGARAPWPWAEGEPIASWPELAAFGADGGTVGSHGRTHVRLVAVDAAALAAELRGSLDELRAHLSQPVPLLAYPHGENDERVRAAAAAAGYHAAFGTSSGRNGAGTDRYRLRRIGPKEWHGTVAFTWMALTGERLPYTIEQLQRRFGRGR